MSEPSACSQDEAPWLASLEDHGRLSFRIKREANLLVAEWIGVGELRATENGSWSEFVPRPGIDPQRVQKLKDGAVDALLRHLEGKISLHGAAVAIDGVAIVCLGEPGAGKSTAVADLSMRAGAMFLSDDVTSLDLAPRGIDVLPSREQHWLLPESRVALGVASDSRTDAKLPLTPSNKARTKVPLGAIALLAFDDRLDAPRVEPILGASRFAALHASLFRFLVDAPDVHMRDFSQMVDLAARAPMFVVKRPRRLDQMARAADALIALARETAR